MTSTQTGRDRNRTEYRVLEISYKGSWEPFGVACLHGELLCLFVSSWRRPYPVGCCLLRDLSPAHIPRSGSPLRWEAAIRTACGAAQRPIDLLRAAAGLPLDLAIRRGCAYDPFAPPQYLGIASIDGPFSGVAEVSADSRELPEPAALENSKRLRFVHPRSG